MVLFCLSFHKNGPAIQPPGRSGIVCHLSVLVVFFSPTTIFKLTYNTCWLCLDPCAIQHIDLPPPAAAHISQCQALNYSSVFALSVAVLSPCPNQICQLISIDLFMKHNLLLCEHTQPELHREVAYNERLCFSDLAGWMSSGCPFTYRIGQCGNSSRSTGSLCLKLCSDWHWRNQFLNFTAVNSQVLACPGPCGTAGQNIQYIYLHMGGWSVYSIVSTVLLS